MENGEKTDTKRRALSLEERMKSVDQKLEDLKKLKQKLKREASSNARKERTHYLIEVGAFVTSRTERAGISGKEETFKKLEELLAQLCQPQSDDQDDVVYIDQEEENTSSQS